MTARPSPLRVEPITKFPPTTWADVLAAAFILALFTVAAAATVIGIS
jgi:hypothetical protein